MKLVKLTMKNFMPYYGVSQVEFPQDPYQNVLVVYGENMRGKTSILNALRWGFYGVAVGRHSKAIPLQNLVNREATGKGEWELETRIEFESDGRRFDLRRTLNRKASVAIPNRPEHFDLRVFLSIDASPISGDQIERELNLVVPEKISRFFLFDGELLQEYEELLIEGSRQGEQIKEAIEQVLGVPALTQGRDDIETLQRKALKDQAAQLRQQEGLETLTEKQAILVSRQETLESDISELRALQAEVVARVREFDDVLDSVESQFEARGRLDTQKAKQRELLQDLQRYRDEKLDLVSRSWVDLVEPKLDMRRSALESERQLVAQRHSVVLANDLRAKWIEEVISRDICETCGQPVEADHSARLAKELETLRAESQFSRPNDEETELIALKASALSRLRGINAREQIHRVDGEIRRLEVDLTSVENVILKLEDDLRGFDSKEMTRVRAQRDAHLKEQQKLASEIETGSRELDKNRAELATLQKSVNTLGGKRGERTVKLAETYSQLAEVFAKSIDNLRDRLRQAVESKASEAFRILSTQKGYKGLAINSNYGLRIIDTDGNQVPLRSAGAEQIVALSLIDGLNRTGRAIGPIVMDTPFGRLDLKHRDRVLGYLPTVASQFVILVHSGEVREASDLASISERIGGSYEIVEVNVHHSQIRRI